MESIKIKKAILAGMVIAIASLLYVSVENPIIGAIIFSFGLLTVFELQLNLFTGKAVDYDKYSFFDFIVFLFGNISGCIIISLFAWSYTKADYIYKASNFLCDKKFNNNFIVLFFSAILCGLLMGLAVRVNQNSNNQIAKTFIIIMCVAIFILIGGEHCIADISYVLFSRKITIDILIKILFLIFGNFIGSMIINTVTKY